MEHITFEACKKLSFSYTQRDEEYTDYDAWESADSETPVRLTIVNPRNGDAPYAYITYDDGTFTAPGLEITVEQANELIQGGEIK